MHARVPDHGRDLRLTAGGRQRLGPGVVRWAEDNEALVDSTRERMVARGGWRQPRWDQVVVLALAEHVRGELVEQTGGVAPTMRSALYRMMGHYGAAKKLYEKLKDATMRARLTGVVRRDFWAESDPLDVRHPGWWTADDALRDQLGPLPRPPLGLRGTGLVVGVVCEAAGQAAGLEGAVRQRLGFGLPVWPLGGMGSLPRVDYVAYQMRRWLVQDALYDGRDLAVLLVITDFDPSGAIIAAKVEEWTRQTCELADVPVVVVRLGITPALALDYGVPLATDTGEELDNSHVQSDYWRDAVAEHGEGLYQAEALDYRQWAGIVADEVESLLVGRPDAVPDHDGDFDAADEVLSGLRTALDSGTSLEDLARLFEP